jgi:fused signal recognition particle receptor
VEWTFRKSVEKIVGFLSKIKSALKKTSEKVALTISGRKADENLRQEIEDALIVADVGVETAVELSQRALDRKFSRETTDGEIKLFLATEIYELLKPYESDFFARLDKSFRSEKKVVADDGYEKNDHKSERSPANKSMYESFVNITAQRIPYVLLIVGVNGNGKTTTLAKIANIFKKSGYSPMLVAGDTFRAAAVEQLKYWADRIGVEFCSAPDKSDAAALVYNAMETAKARRNGVVLVDTAGRMQNREDLMAELEKIKRVMGKIDASSPHSTLMVLDGLTGQSAHSQVDVFLHKVGIDGIIITKLDGTAKGGAVVPLTKKYGIPLVAVGTGEKVDDISPFDALDFSRGLLGID